MGSNRTSEEILANYSSIMGEELGNVFHKLKNEIIFLHQQWNTYTDLYGTEDSRIDILNRGAPSFFFIVQRGLFENIIMSLARLTDPPTTGKFKNFTLRTLPDLIGWIFR